MRHSLDIIDKKKIVRCFRNMRCCVVMHDCSNVAFRIHVFTSLQNFEVMITTKRNSDYYVKLLAETFNIPTLYKDGRALIESPHDLTFC